MEDKNKLAKEIYQQTFNEMRDLMNQHWQISLANPIHPALNKLKRRIRQLAACCEVWKMVAGRNAAKYFEEGT